MNRKLFRIPSLFVGILLTVPLFAFAQNEDEDDTVTLSPFTIEEGDSVGHQATNTLAGSRLKTPLRDVGSAIQVITSQLFEDTGATTMEEILPYALNIESNGALGNFADGLLQGFTAGGGVRWQDRNAIGYPNIFSSDGQVIPDLASPFLGPEQLNGDIFFSYRRLSGMTRSIGSFSSTSAMRLVTMIRFRSRSTQMETSPLFAIRSRRPCF
ncbi:hypothetical protein F7C95_08365 [Opitutia bacterium ISCC 51]|nr:hypothetical protein F7C95_08365 [Opitutae bacterium ISCC 51]QXD29950.1 hypothetical protein GA003_08310 [Opitutae bacterium ISCC 52]